MALLRLCGKPPEELGVREPVYLDSGYVSTKLDPESLKTLASARRQALFNVTLLLDRRAVSTVGWVAGLVGEAGASPHLSLVLPENTPGRWAWVVDVYTDVLPLNVALYLDTSVPDELGPKAVRLRELAASVRKLKALGARVPRDMALEMEGLGREIWAAAGRTRRLRSVPGTLEATYLTSTGVRRLRLAAKPGSSLSPAIRALHRTLSGELGVPGDPATGSEITEAFISARAGGYGEARLPATLVARKAGGGLELNGSGKGRKKAIKRVIGWEEAPSELAAQVLDLTRGLFEVRQVGVTRSPVWLMLKGDAFLRVEWVPERSGREEERPGATLGVGVA